MDASCVVGAMIAFSGTILFLGASIYDHIKRLADINASAAVQMSANSSILVEVAYLPPLPQSQTSSDPAA